MSIDITQQVQQIAQQTIQQAATQAVQDAAQQGNQAVKDAAAALHQESLTLIGGLGDRLAKLEQQGIAALPQLETRLLTVGDAIATNAEHDQTTQRHLALLLVFLLGEAAILMLVFYCVPATSPQVKGIIGLASLPAIGSALVAWAATGFNIPRTPAKVTPTTP